MHSMQPAKSPRATWIRRLRLPLMGVLLGLVSAAPMAASAETRSSLPKGYTTDELPTLPPSIQAPPIQRTSDTEVVDADGYVDTDPSALTDFREPLSPHGTWVEDSTYGTVWVPSAAVVGTDFAPYQTAGHWSMTEDDEWVWVSDYDWGHIPFHYGRWVWISGRGWSWIPGRVYAPSWVIWRVSDHGYIGWAPMPPSYYWSGGSAVGLWIVPPAPYVFVSTTHVFHHHVHQHIVHDHTTVKHIASKSRVYRGANASVGGGNSPNKGSSGSAGGSSAGRSSYRPAAPTLAEAKVPKSAAPKARITPNSKAMAFARRSTSPKAKLGGPMDRGVDRGVRMAPGGRGSSPQRIELPRGNDPRGNDPRADEPRIRERPQGSPAIRIPRPIDGGQRRMAPPSHDVPRSQPQPPVFHADPPARGNSSPPPQVQGGERRRIVVPSEPSKAAPPEKSESRSTPRASSSPPPAARSAPPPAARPAARPPARVSPPASRPSRGHR